MKTALREGEQRVEAAWRDGGRRGVRGQQLENAQGKGKTAIDRKTDRKTKREGGRGRQRETDADRRTENGRNVKAGRQKGTKRGGRERKGEKEREREGRCEGECVRARYEARPGDNEVTVSTGGRSMAAMHSASAATYSCR